MARLISGGKLASCQYKRYVGGSRRIAAVGSLALLVLVVALAGCGTSANGSGPTKLTVGLTYVPNIQFAPFYVAQALGYYRDAGLDVTFHHHGASEDEFAALVAGQEDAIFAGGDEIVGARAHNVPIVDVATVYTRYPVVAIVPASSPIQSAADLRGHTIGVPGAYGATYIGLLALLSIGWPLAVRRAHPVHRLYPGDGAADAQSGCHHGLRE